MRVSAEGGEPEVLTTPDYAAGEIGHLAPQLLPDQKHVLFTARRGGSGQAAILSLATGQWQRLEELGSLSEVRYLPTGHLAYLASDSALTVVPFDLDRFEPTGPATTATMIGSGLTSLGNSLEPQFHASRQGLLAFTRNVGERVALASRFGEVAQTLRRTGPHPRFSPNGTRVFACRLNE